MYRSKATIVVPTGISFPIDMLRYDQCFPANQNAVLDIGAINNLRIKYVMIEKVAETKGLAGFTIPRWESFGVKVTDIEISKA